MIRLSSPNPDTVARYLPWIFAFSFLSFMSESFIGSKIVIGSFLLIWWIDNDFIREMWRSVRSIYVPMAIFLVLMTLLSMSRVESLRAGLSVFKSWLVFFPVVWITLRSGKAFHLAWLYGMFFFGVAGLAACIFTTYNILLPGMQDAGGEGINWFSNRNSFAVTLGFSWIIGVAWLSSTTWSRKNSQLILAIILILAVIAYDIYFNRSRGGVLATVAATALIILVRLPWRSIIRFGMPVFTAFLLAVWVSRNNITSYFIHRNLMNGRDEVYALAWRSIKANPWLGQGPDTFKVDEYVIRHSVEGGYNTTHDIYIDILYSTGVVGLVFWLVHFIRMYRLASYPALTINAKAIDRQELQFYGCLIIGFAGYMAVHGLVDFGFYRQMPGVIFSFCFGIYYALRVSQEAK